MCFHDTTGMWKRAPIPRGAASIRAYWKVALKLECSLSGNTTGWKCSHRYCAHFNTCPGGHGL